MADALFWNRRLARYGHTGWSDFATYFYDQRLRLNAIEHVVLDDAPSMPLPHARALDFGCGVGDFSDLLAERFDEVIGYDVSDAIVRRARARHPQPRIRFTARLDEALVGPHDLILCVTVLQHVVDDDELARLLRRCAAALAPGGRMAVMETLSPNEKSGEQSSGQNIKPNAGYLKRRTLAQLRALFEGAGMVLRERRAFYHPTEAPTPVYARYRSRPDVRLLARLAGWKLPVAQMLLQRIATRAADADQDFLPRTPSPTQILVFSRVDDA